MNIYLCFLPEDRALAERIDVAPRTNLASEVYDARTQVPIKSLEAEAIQRELCERIRAADVTVCIIGQDTHKSAWIEWELEQSKQDPGRNGLVAVRIESYHINPPAIGDSGAIFVPFKRDAVERAIKWAATEHFTKNDFTLADE